MMEPSHLVHCPTATTAATTRPHWSQEPEHQSWPPAEWERPEPAGLPHGTCVSTRLDLRLRHSDEAMRLQLKKKKKFSFKYKGQRRLWQKATYV